MNALLGLMQRHPLIFFHLVTAFGALLLGLFMLLRRKGTRSHRAARLDLGGADGQHRAGLGLHPRLPAAQPVRLHADPSVHLTVAVMLPLGIWYVKHGRIDGHRKTMRGLYIGACIIAGLFTLLPGRFLGSLLWGTPMNGIAS